jgi:hypothetical protein
MIGPVTSLEWALAFWGRGLNVIPVPRPGGAHDGKRPTVCWKKWQQHRQTKRDIVAWFARADLNVAVITGEVSGVVVVDADSGEAIRWAMEKLPATPWLNGTPRGLHLFYGWPGCRVPNRAKIQTSSGRLDVDLRGDGGYVIAPGSLHASGAQYRMLGDWTVPTADLPVLPRKLLEQAQRPPARIPPARVVGDVAERGRRYLAGMPKPVEGQGSDVHTFRAACKLVRGLCLEEAVALDLLQEWAPHFDRWWLRRKVASAFQNGKEPMGGLLAGALKVAG